MKLHDADWTLANTILREHFILNEKVSYQRLVAEFYVVVSELGRENGYPPINDTFYVEPYGLVTSGVRFKWGSIDWGKKGITHYAGDAMGNKCFYPSTELRKKIIDVQDYLKSYSDAGLKSLMTQRNDVWMSASKNRKNSIQNMDEILNDTSYLRI